MQHSKCFCGDNLNKHIKSEDDLRKENPILKKMGDAGCQKNKEIALSECKKTCVAISQTLEGCWHLFGKDSTGTGTSEIWKTKEYKNWDWNTHNQCEKPDTCGIDSAQNGGDNSMCVFKTDHVVGKIKYNYYYLGEGGCKVPESTAREECRKKDKCLAIGKQSNGCWHLLTNTGSQRKNVESAYKASFVAYFYLASSNDPGCHNDKGKVEKICSEEDACAAYGQQHNGCWQLLSHTGSDRKFMNSYKSIYTK
jgi:hypothetical protein